MNRIFVRRALVVFLCSLFLLVGTGSAEPPAVDEYGQLRERYLKLRNTDIRLTKADEWRTVAQLLTNYADAHQEQENAASALFNASVLYEKLYRRSQDRLDIETSVGLLERFLTHYPNASLTEQALMRFGDLLLNDFNKKNPARIAYEVLLKRFPRSSLVVSARMRKESIDAEAEGKPQQPMNAEDMTEVLNMVPDRAEATGSTRETRTPSGRGPVIVLDPGHGGEDFGAVGVKGVMEKDVVMEVAQRLRAQLEAKLDARVWMTRSGDQFVALAERTEFANQKNADVFVSIHTNASPDHAQQGFETYFLDNTDDASSQKLAERENGTVDRASGSGDLAFMLSDLIQSGKLEASQRLATMIQQSLEQTLHKRSRSRGVRKAPFYVLVGAHMPCVLVEILFIDHPEEGKRLADQQFQRELSQGLFEGIQRFLSLKAVVSKKATPEPKRPVVEKKSTKTSPVVAPTRTVKVPAKRTQAKEPAPKSASKSKKVKEQPKAKVVAPAKKKSAKGK